MIRTAKDVDLPRVVEMGQRFIDESPYREKVHANLGKMAATVKQISDAGTLLVSERDGNLVGMLGFLLFPHFVSGEIMAAELFWWMEPEHRGEGLKLLRAAEKMARSNGATKMQMVAPDERVASLYQRLDYGYVESTYQKSL